MKREVDLDDVFTTGSLQERLLASILAELRQLRDSDRQTVTDNKAKPAKPAKPAKRGILARLFGGTSND